MHPVYIRSGLVWEKAELYWLRRFVASLGPRGIRAPVVLDFPVAGVWGRHWSLDGRGLPGARSAWDSVYLPGRNLILLSQAAVYCRRRGIGEIAIGTLKGNPFAEVWKSWQVRTHKWVEVKVFTQRKGGNRLFLQSEVERLIKLDKHPRIVSLLDADLMGEPAYYVVDFLEAGTLDQFIDPAHPAPVD